MLGDLNKFAVQRIHVTETPRRATREEYYPSLLEVEIEGPRARDLASGYPGRIGELRRQGDDYWTLAEAPAEIRSDLKGDSHWLRNILLGTGLGAVGTIGLGALGAIPRRLSPRDALGIGALGGGVLGGLLSIGSKPSILKERDFERYGISPEDLV